jgi:hypothetical protein
MNTHTTKTCLSVVPRQLPSVPALLLRSFSRHVTIYIYVYENETKLYVLLTFMGYKSRRMFLFLATPCFSSGRFVKH